MKAVSTLDHIVRNIVSHYDNPLMNTSLVASVLLVAMALAAYEFAVYRLVSHRAFYNKSFNICIAVLPLFISTIILCLQSSLVITLGTIGALAIIRFRTAVKDPVDMVYLLWSIHIGISCGCQLYEVAVLTALAVTVFLLILDRFSLGRRPFVLVFHCGPEAEKAALETIRSVSRRSRVKSRNYTSDGMDYVVEFAAKDPAELTARLRETGVEKFSIIEYDSEDII